MTLLKRRKKHSQYWAKMLGIMSGNDKNVLICVAAAIFGDEYMRIVRS